MILIILLAFIFFVVGFYFLYLKPKRALQRLAAQASFHGYKTKLLPFQFMKYYIIKHYSQNQFSLKTLKQDWSQYDVIVGNLFSDVGIMTGKPELIKDVCNHISNFEKSPFISQVFKIFNGGGIIFTQGQVWKRKRRIISSVFHYDFLNNMAPSIENQIDKSFNQIEKQLKKGKTQFNLRSIFTKILSNIIAKSFFGTNMEEYQIQGKPYCEYFVQFLENIGSFMGSWEHMIFGMKCYQYNLTKKCRQLKKKYNLLQSIAKQITLKEVQKIKRNEETNKNILTALYENNMLNLQGSENEEQYSLFELIGQFFAFFATGTDTTTNTVNLMLHYLSERPQLVKKIRVQCDQVSTLKLQTSEKLKRLKVCEAVFNETLRMNGPAGNLFTRRALKDITIGNDLKILKGTYVTLSPILCHYRQSNYQKADKFIPERWLNDTKIEPYTFIPFGGGQRNCIGQYLARIEAKLLLSKICEKYQFKTLHPIKMKIGFVYATQDGDFQIKFRQKTK